MWAVGLAGIAIAAVAGQAIGPVLAGNVTGTANVTAQQSIVAATSSSVTLGNSTNKGLVVVNDEGTSFTAAMEQHVGDQGQVLNLTVKNNSNSAANAVLQLNVPRGIDVKVNSEATTTLQEALLSTNHAKTQQSWLLHEEAGATSTNLQITIESKDDVAPGTYTISGGLVQIAG